MRGTKKRKVSIVSGKLMSTRDVAQSLGISVDSVQDAAKRLSSTSDNFPKFKQGQTPRYNESQVTAIKLELKNRSKVNDFSPKTMMEKQLFIHQAMRMQEEIIADLQAQALFLTEKNETLTEENKTLRIELDESKEYMTVKRMEQLNPGKHFDWRLLKKESERLGYERKEVFDANYGTVKAYHVKVWESLYFDNINYPAA